MADAEDNSITEKDNSKSAYLIISTVLYELRLIDFFLVCILLNATGNVPIIKKRKWTVDPNKTVNWIQKFIHQYLKMDENEEIVSPSNRRKKNSLS